MRRVSCYPARAQCPTACAASTPAACARLSYKPALTVPSWGSASACKCCSKTARKDPLPAWVFSQAVSCAFARRRASRANAAFHPSNVATLATSCRPSTAMQIIPAIDIKDGHCVRLKQGEMQSATVFSEDPAAMAQHWLELGAQRLHIVDLNGAFAGKPKNELAIREVVSVIGEEIPVQLGGGIRDLDTIERYLDESSTYDIIGPPAA